MSQTSNNLASESWAIADLLRGDFKQSQYGRIILPFCLLRRLECVLEPTKEAVLAKFQEIQPMNLPEEAHEKMLLRATKTTQNSDGLSFFNTSKMDLSKLGETGIKANLENYIQGFSKDAREIFEHFKFMEFVGLLNDANLLYKVVQKIRTIDLSPKAISNHDMGLVFEELIRRFAEGSNETAGEHFTPRDIVRLTTSLVFMEDDEALTKPGIIRTIYDPTAGTGGFLSAGMEYVHELNPQAVMRAYGQELNPESYAICKADMLIKGQEVGNIKLGNTLSNDHLYADKFDYMLSNPPFGVDWKKIESDIQDEHKLKGFDGRFGAGLPRVSDGSLLFLLHLISKLRGADDDVHGSTSGAGGRMPVATNGGRIGIILNGSPLFTGGAGSGESEIRRYILEADLLEAIVALPTDMFYNTGIATYIWILSNKKSNERKGKVQLINGTDLCSKMRKSLGSKRNVMDEGDIATITRCFGDFEAVDAYSLDKAADVKSNRGRQAASPKADIPKTFASKIFATHEFGYRRITIERPLRLSAQFTNDAIASLRFANGALKPVMEWIYQHLGDEWTEASSSPEKNSYGQLANHEDAIRTKIKKDFADIKEKQIKDVLDAEIWLAQKALMEKAQTLRAFFSTEGGDAQHNDFNEFDKTLTQAQKTTGIKLDAKEQKQLLDAITWKNPEAEPIVKKVLKTKAVPIYGQFEYNGKVVEFETDGDLRDNENVPLNPSLSVNEINETYFKKEVQPHVPDAWINPDKRDDKDKEIGIVGYEIPFNRHFYVYQPPRKLEEIDADLDAVTKSILELLQEVHS
jgi:type I restriction enzyme M protein